ncbi:MAG: dihydroorotase, partial [Methanomicrobiales archaeon HGW-Methanomicrobiales-4]
MTVLRDVLIPGGRVADITLEKGIVSHIGASGRADTTIRCADLIVVPAGVDMHVHMRDGVQAYKEDWESGTRSALAGGVTVVIDQPNTIPPITTAERLLDRVHLASEKAYCHFGINGGVTDDADLEGMSKAGAMAFGETFAGPSSYGEAISKEDLSTAMARISRLKGLITVHAEVVTEGDDTDLTAHDRLRPAIGEQNAVSMIQSIPPPGSRVHYCHISSADTISDIKTHEAGTIEVTPHHLFLSYESFSHTDSRVKVNPPVRTDHERRRLWESWDRIDVIASDHAPHTLYEKSGPFPQVPSGIP